MSKRAEELAERYADRQLEIVDKELFDSNYSRYTKMGTHLFEGSDIEEAYLSGYEQAEKDIWNKIEKYLSEQAPGNYATAGFILKNFEYFKQQIMEEEQ